MLVNSEAMGQNLKGIDSFDQSCRDSSGVLRGPLLDVRAIPAKSSAARGIIRML